jgi:hypothetical protein
MDGAEGTRPRLLPLVETEMAIGKYLARRAM